jgi:hypothetical protein
MHKKVGRKRNHTKSGQNRGCSKQFSRKYTSRPSPPYPANLCRNVIMKGNNGRMFRSNRVLKSGKALFKWEPLVKKSHSFGTKDYCLKCNKGSKRSKGLKGLKVCKCNKSAILIIK